MLTLLNRCTPATGARPNPQLRSEVRPLAAATAQYAGAGLELLGARRCSQKHLMNPALCEQNDHIWKGELQ